MKRAASAPSEVCRIIVKSAGGGEGTVGAENVFGGEILERLLEHKPAAYTARSVVFRKI